MVDPDSTDFGDFVSYFAYIICLRRFNMTTGFRIHVMQFYAYNRPFFQFLPKLPSSTRLYSNNKTMYMFFMHQTHPTCYIWSKSSCRHILIISSPSYVHMDIMLLKIYMPRHALLYISRVISHTLTALRYAYTCIFHVIHAYIHLLSCHIETIFLGHFPVSQEEEWRTITLQMSRFKA